MTLKAYEEVADFLVLPIAGKQYKVPGIGIADAQRFDAVFAGESDEEIPDEEFFRMFLGAVFDEMVSDGVPYPAMRRAAMAALADHRHGRVVAEIMWATGGEQPEPETPKRPVRKSTPGKAK